MPRPEPGAVRHPVLKGRQRVAALWFPAGALDEATRARRLVANWRPGASALRFDEGDLLRHPLPQEEDCTAQDGWPLHREGGVLCSAPLSEAERAALPAADLWIVRGAQVLALRLDEGRPLDPSAWLSLQHCTLLDSYDFPAELPPPVVLAPDARPLREVLQGVPPASAQREAFMRELAQRAAGARAGAPQAGGRNAMDARAPAGRTDVQGLRTGLAFALALVLIAGAWSSGGTTVLVLILLLFAVVLIVGLLFMLATLFGWKRPTGASLLSRFLRLPTQWESGPGQAGGQGTAAAQRAATGAGPSAVLRPRRLREAMPQRWRNWLARLAIASQVSRLLGQRQGEHLKRMLRMFEDGQLDEALRHAIPLSDDPADSLGQAFGTMGRRDGLQLGQSLGRSASLHLGEDVREHLRRTYRRSFEKLDREGRIDEAVFVLAELLNARQEAMDYLEKHGRHAQAAELALAWDLPAAQIVRLHVLAGDWRTALAVARRDQAFAAAVLELEKRWPDAARRLRTEWAEALVQQGDWMGAVEAAWPVEELRTRSAEWLQAAEAAGGVLGARALVRRAQLLPDTMQRHAARLQALRDDRGLHDERSALGLALLELAGSSRVPAWLAAAIAPAVLADLSQGRGRLNRHQAERLVQAAQDPLLRADLPTKGWPAPAHKPLMAYERPLQLDPPSPGAHAIADAVALGDGRCLLALGESGVLLIDGRGRALARFAVPAERLVIAHSGQVALALARRESVWRVARLDLVQRRSTDLGWCEIDHFGLAFDGVGWMVARGNRVMVLDTANSLQDVLWQVDKLPGPVRALTCTGQVEQFLTQELGPDGAPSAQFILWRYELPRRRLFFRDCVSTTTLDPQFGAMQLNQTHDASEPARAGGRLQWKAGVLDGRADLLRAGFDGWALEPGGSWLMLSQERDGARDLQLLATQGGKPGARLTWPAGAQPRLRCCGGTWLVFDDRGRLLWLDAETAAWQGLSVH